MSYKARVPNVTTEGQSSTIKRCSLTAFRFCQNQKSQQPAKVLLQQQLLQEGFLSRFGKAGCLAQWSQLVSVQSRINGSVQVHGFGMKATPCSSLPQANCKEPLEQGPINWGFEPTVPCRFCIRETQFYTVSLQKHCKSCKKSGPRNQSSSADTVKSIKERSSPCVILRGKSSTKGNHCQG